MSDAKGLVGTMECPVCGRNYPHNHDGDIPVYRWWEDRHSFESAYKDVASDFRTTHEMSADSLDFSFIYTDPKIEQAWLLWKKARRPFLTPVEVKK